MVFQNYKRNEVEIGMTEFKDLQKAAANPSVLTEECAFWARLVTEKMKKVSTALSKAREQFKIEEAHSKREEDSSTDWGDHT